MLGATILLYFSFVSLGNSGGLVPSISKAKESAHPVFSVIDEPSLLDIREKQEDAITDIDKGLIQFKNVIFNYPTREQLVLNNFNIEIPASSKIALVGHSGCGKTTITNLLLRFYDI